VIVDEQDADDGCRAVHLPLPHATANGDDEPSRWYGFRR
jgi:hypothetical protein